MLARNAVMLLPSSWNRLKRKRLSLVEDDCQDVHGQGASSDVDVTHLKGIITRHIQHAGPVPDAPEDWQWLLNKLTIAKML